MEKNTISCNQCGKDRAEVNGWHGYDDTGQVFKCGKSHGDRKWKQHACGQLCMHKALDAFFATQKALTAQEIPTVQETTPEPPTEAKEPPVEPLRGKGLTVEALVAEQGGDPAKAVYEGFIPLPCDDGESVRVIEQEPKKKDDDQTQLSFEGN